MTKGQKKQAIGIVVMLLVLVAALLALKLYNKNANENKAQEEEAAKILAEEEIVTKIDLHQGEAAAKAWGCDLTYDYVKINGDYRS